MKKRTSKRTRPATPGRSATGRSGTGRSGTGRSSITRLPAALREGVDQAVADGATIDRIVDLIRAEGEDCSRSAVGRYAKDTRDLIRQQQETDRTIRAWVDALGERPEGGTGPILIETLRTMVLATMAHLSKRGEPVSSQELARLSHVLKRIEDTDRLRLTREQAEREEKTETAAKAGSAAGPDPDRAEKGLSPEVVAALREAVTGLPSQGPVKPKKAVSPEAVAAMRESLLGRPPRTVTSVPVDPWNPDELPAVPANPGESRSTPDDPAERWPEIAPRVCRTSPTSILSLGPEPEPA